MKISSSSLFAGCISLALLFGCGSESKKTVPKINHITKDDIAHLHDSFTATKVKIIRVIDGYLNYADIYVDRNSNQKADTDEKLATKTNFGGMITIPFPDTKFDLIAQINGTTTKDSDGKGTTGRSYQMIAKAGLNYITPFTTIAKIQNKTLAAIAADLNISEAAISGDYIKLKKNTEKVNEAKKAHAYARNLTTIFSEKISSNKIQTINRVINEIKTEINTAENNNADLDRLNMNNTVKLQDLFVAGNTFYNIQLNPSKFSKKEIKTLNINENSRFTQFMDKETKQGLFKFSSGDANVVTFTMADGTKIKDQPISIAQNSYISIDAQHGIMDIYSKTMQQQVINKSTFADTQWYQLFDNSTPSNSARSACLIKVNFKADGSMKYSEMTECKVSEESVPQVFPFHWEVAHNLLLTSNDNRHDDRALHSILSSNEQMMVAVNVMENSNTQTFNTKTALYIKDKTQALKLLNAWKAAN